MFLSRNEKNDVYLCKPQFYYIKVGLKGVNILWACFHDDGEMRLPLSLFHVPEDVSASDIRL